MFAELIVRLEKVEGPDRDLDIDIAKACLPEHHSGRWGRINTPEFTRSIDAALMLLTMECTWKLDATMFQPRAEVWADPGIFEGRHTIAAIALCIAALRAREDQ